MLEVVEIVTKYVVVGGGGGSGGGGNYEFKEEIHIHCVLKEELAPC